MRPANSRLGSLDWRAVAVSLSLPALYWVLAVGMITMFGYPGIACMTPAAWLLALPVASRCVRQSKSQEPSTRVWEAGIAGALLGVLQGVVFAAALLSTPSLQSEQFGGAVMLSVTGLLVGTAAGGVIGGLIAAFMVKRGL